jgi:hypothetical protein
MEASRPKHSYWPDGSTIPGNYGWLFVLLKLNSAAWVREQTIPTEKRPLVGEVSANLCGQRGATWSAWRIPTAVFSVF